MACGIRLGLPFSCRPPAFRRIAVTRHRACGRHCRAGAIPGPFWIALGASAGRSFFACGSGCAFQAAAATHTSPLPCGSVYPPLLPFIDLAGASASCGVFLFQGPLAFRRRLLAGCRPAARPAHLHRPDPAFEQDCLCAAYLAAGGRLPLDHHRRSTHAHQRHSFASRILLRQYANAATAMTRGLFPTLASRSSPRGLVLAPLPPGLPTGRRTDASFEASGERAHLAPGPFAASRFTRRWHAH